MAITGPDHDYVMRTVMLSDVRLSGGEPLPTDPRYALRRALERAAELGFTKVGPEIEFFLFAATDEGAPRPLDDGAYFDLSALDASSDFRRRTIEHLEHMSIPVKASHHEVAASQHEIDHGHTDALSMADAIATLRLAVREVARELGVFASFREAHQSQVTEFERTRLLRAL